MNIGSASASVHYIGGGMECVCVCVGGGGQHSAYLSYPFIQI